MATQVSLDIETTPAPTRSRKRRPMPARRPQSRPTLMLVDGFGLIFRAFFALDKSVSTMSTSSGEPTGAVFGFASMLLDTMRTQQPDYVDRRPGGRAHIPARGLFRVQGEPPGDA